MKKRLEYFDVVKGIGAILVLLGHLQGDQIFSYSPYFLPMCEWIFSFHMPLFFIVSGMLISYRNDISKDYNETVKKRFKGIMIPYFWFCFFYMTVVIVALIKGEIAPYTLYLNLFYVLSMYGMSVLWFLPALFLGEILFIFLIKKFGDKKGAGCVYALGAIALILLVFVHKGTYETELLKRVHDVIITCLRPFVAATFVGAGYYGFKLVSGWLYRHDVVDCDAKAIKDMEASSDCFVEVGPLQKFINTPVKQVVFDIALGIILMIIGLLNVNHNHGVDFRSLVIKNYFFYYLCALTSSFGLILICKHIRPFKILTFFGVNSLIFMGVHGSETVVYWATQLAMWVNQFLTRARGYICYAIIVLVILVYVSIMIVLINRFAPFILGKPFSLKTVLKKTDKK